MSTGIERLYKNKDNQKTYINKLIKEFEIFSYLISSICVQKLANSTEDNKYINTYIIQLGEE